MTTYIAYYRVSTNKQKKTNLGLSSQKKIVSNFIQDKSTLLGEYEEIESGKLSKRPKLEQAIEHAKQTNSTLIIAALDRLSRNVKFIYTLKESNVKFICADMPEANNLTIGLLAVIAEDEANRIASRTKKALEQIKQNIKTNKFYIAKSGNKITTLGSPNNLTQEARKKGNQTMRLKSLENTENKKTAMLILSLKQQNKSYNEIATILNQSGFKTVRNNQFYPTQVRNLYNQHSNN